MIGSKKCLAAWATVLTVMGTAATASAHFQMIIPSKEMIEQGEPRTINLDVRFWHPMEGRGMNMDMPVQFGVLEHGRKTSLLGSLKAAKAKDREGGMRGTFSAAYEARKPGDYVFYVEPKPYWEAAEQKYIIHYTKTVVDSLGLQVGWDQPVGLKAEIIPLTRPYGLFTGNVFQGQLWVDGKAVPGAEVEVEYYDEKGTMKPFADPMITQVIKTDPNGVFTYAMPRAGWWGFSALTDGKPMKRDGKDVAVEIGALIWVKTHDQK